MQSNNYNRQVIDLKEDEGGFTSQSKSSYGYCKIETRGRKCRIKVSVNGLLKSKGYKAHLVKINENTTTMIPIGIIDLDDNVGSLNISTDSEKVMGTDNSIDEFSIIAITGKENNDNPKFPIVGYIKEVNHPWKKNIEKNNTYKTKNQNVKKLEKTHNHVHEKVKGQQPSLNKHEEINKSGKNEQVQEPINQNINENNETRQSIEIDDIGNQTFDIIKKHFNKKELNKIHHNIFNEYPKMNPFEDDYSDKEWVRIEPADIIYFPMETWMLTNNTFLINAYRKYKHLILGRDKKSFNENPYFILGVPGVFYPKDRVAAYFYGFKEFVCCSGTKAKAGEYGYWINRIECLM